MHQKLVAPKGIPNQSVILHAVLKGTIASIPKDSPNKTQFIFSIEQYNNHPAKGLIQLASYNNFFSFHAGQRWQLDVKMKKPRNFHNPGSYDYETSLKKHHIEWTGYLRLRNNHLLPASHHSFGWQALREHLSQVITELAPREQTAGIIEALTLNVTTHIEPTSWELFRRTGTIHLFGISGEHIALISGLFTALFRWIWTRSTRLCLKIPAQSIAGLLSFPIALLYAFLAGFEPPVQRALIGCFFYTLYCLGQKKYTPWQVWRYALVGVLVLEPHAVFMQGFYFSFLAVACILITQKRWPAKGFKTPLVIQLSCLVGLMPLSLYWFSYGSINGFLANLLAIPLVGFLIVPCSLLFLLVSPFFWSTYLMSVLNWLVKLLFIILTTTEHLSWLNITCSIHSIHGVILLMGAFLMWALLPVRPFRYFALIWLLLPWFPHRTPIHPKEFVVQVLDVGQGLSVLVQTQNHVLLYDTGDQFFKGSDMGAMVILPYLQTLGIKKIDTLIISHPDKDHRGGLKSIQQGLEVAKLIVNEPKAYHQGINCHRTPQWVWDGVIFRFLPISKHFKDKNNNCCVLQIINKAGRVLFTGDIEQAAEDYLITKYGDELKSEVLIVPHHGSKTSSSYRFLLEVSPRYALASLGFDNLFRFPHQKTLQSMSSLNIPFYRTDECGMLSLHFAANGLINRPKCLTKN